MSPFEWARSSLPKLWRRTGEPVPAPRPDAAEPVYDERPKAFGVLGVEIWRLERRLADFDQPRIKDSHGRLVKAFEAAGGRIEDRTGETFFDGMRAEILDQPDASEPDARLVVAETVRPAVYLDDRRIVEAQVILAIAEPEEL